MSLIDGSDTLRPVGPDQLPGKVRKADDVGIEVDAMPGGFVCSGSMKRALPEGDVQEVVPGDARCASCSPRSSGGSMPITLDYFSAPLR